MGTAHGMLVIGVQYIVQMKRLLIVLATVGIACFALCSALFFG